MPSFTTVTLSKQEFFYASQVGTMRQIASVLRGLPDRHGAKPADGWSLHIEGACGELAFARASGRFWSPSVDTFKSQGDVGGVEVRTRSEHHFELIVRESDDPSRVYALVTGRSPAFRVHGWLVGVDARRADWLRTHGNREAAYFVPQSELRPLKELPAC